MSRDVPPSPQGVGLKRDPALVGLSRDHHFALRHALWMRRASTAAEPGPAATAVRDFLEFERAELRDHFADEEEVVFPKGDAVDPEGTARLRAEHDEMRAAFGRLRAGLEAGGDLRVPAGELAALLDDHVRYEERAYFENLQKRLGESEMQEIGRVLAERRGPARCGWDGGAAG